MGSADRAGVRLSKDEESGIISKMGFEGLVMAARHGWEFLKTTVPLLHSKSPAISANRSAPVDLIIQTYLIANVIRRSSIAPNHSKDVMIARALK